VLAYGYWQSRFGGKLTVIGQTVHVNGYPFEIVGIVQAGFEGIDIAQPAQIYVPITMQPKLGPSWLQLETRRLRWVQVYGRMRRDLTAESTQSGLQPLYRALLEQEANDAVAGASGETKRRFSRGDSRSHRRHRGTPASVNM
jgi:hypothetical protein